MTRRSDRLKPHPVPIPPGLLRDGLVVSSARRRNNLLRQLGRGMSEDRTNEFIELQRTPTTPEIVAPLKLNWNYFCEETATAIITIDPADPNYYLSFGTAFDLARSQLWAACSTYCSDVANWASGKASGGFFDYIPGPLGPTISKGVTADALVSSYADENATTQHNGIAKLSGGIAAVYVAIPDGKSMQTHFGVHTVKFTSAAMDFGYGNLYLQQFVAAPIPSPHYAQYANPNDSMEVVSGVSPLSTLLNHTMTAATLEQTVTIPYTILSSHNFTSAASTGVLASGSDNVWYMAVKPGPTCFASNPLPTWPYNTRQHLSWFGARTGARWGALNIAEVEFFDSGGGSLGVWNY